MKLELARQNDFDAIIAFYDDVTVHTPDMALYARWSKGKHPTEESIRRKKASDGRKHPSLYRRGLYVSIS